MAITCLSRRILALSSLPLRIGPSALLDVPARVPGLFLQTESARPFSLGNLLSAAIIVFCIVASFQKMEILFAGPWSTVARHS